MDIQPEPISYPFSVYDADGKVVYRDALTFANPSEFRETSEAEREAMRQQRYENWKANVAQMTAQAQEETETPEAE